MADGLTADELRVTLALQGWVAMRWTYSPGGYYWGASKAGVGRCAD